jgi:hypothetical protein
MLSVPFSLSPRRLVAPSPRLSMGQGPKIRMGGPEKIWKKRYEEKLKLS